MRRGEIVAAARGWLGTPYRHQAATRGAGCDCLGLLRGVWRELYGGEPLAVPPYRADWRDAAHRETLRLAADRLLWPAGESLQAGQVLLFRLGRIGVPRHCGIAIAADRFIHAQEGLGVVEANLTDGWATRIAGRYDFPGVTI
jgi:NlpC/P60 family putative phage cell wall peptidase